MLDSRIRGNDEGINVTSNCSDIKAPMPSYHPRKTVNMLCKPREGPLQHDKHLSAPEILNFLFCACTVP
jgi:hypothetical protein